jgi:four helix bundle protein
MARIVGDLQVFQKARTGADAVFALLQQPPLAREHDLISQLKRASVRVISDIAEGFEQKSDRHFARYLYDARGSAAEIRAQLAVAASRYPATGDSCSAVVRLYEEVGRMLTGLIKHLEREDRADRRRK